MRKSLIGGAVLLGGLMAVSGAMAQSNWSGMTCSDFTKLDANSQASIAGQIGPSDSAQSQTSNSGLSSTNETGKSSTANEMVASSGNDTSTQPVTAAQIASACEAAPANTTLHDLLSKPGSLQSGTTK